MAKQRVVKSWFLTADSVEQLALLAEEYLKLPIQCLKTMDIAIHKKTLRKWQHAHDVRLMELKKQSPTQ